MSSLSIVVYLMFYSALIHRNLGLAAEVGPLTTSLRSILQPWEVPIEAAFSPSNDVNESENLKIDPFAVFVDTQESQQVDSKEMEVSSFLQPELASRNSTEESDSDSRKRLSVSEKLNDVVNESRPAIYETRFTLSTHADTAYTANPENGTCLRDCLSYCKTERKLRQLLLLCNNTFMGGRGFPPPEVQKSAHDRETQEDTNNQFNVLKKNSKQTAKESGTSPSKIGKSPEYHKFKKVQKVQESPTNRSFAEFLFKVSERIGTKIVSENGSEVHLDVREGVGEPNAVLTLQDICLTENCILKAAELKKRMNSSVDPCQNFYQFSCGRFLKKEIPENRMSWSVFDEIGESMISRMNSLLKTPSSCFDPPFVQLLKRFYQICASSSPKMIMLEALKELGGWPERKNKTWTFSSSSWPEIAFNWTYGMFVEYNMVRANLTHDDTFGSWILSLDVPILIGLATRFNSSAILDQFSEETLELAEVLNLDLTATADALEEVRVFMSSAVTYAEETQHLKKEGVYQLSQLKTWFPHLKLLSHLPEMLRSAVRIEDDEMIRVKNLKYLTKINSLLRDTPMRTQAIYFVMSAMNLLYKLLSSLDGHTIGKFCVQLAWKFYPSFIGRLYAINHVDDPTVTEVRGVLNKIRDSLKNTLQSNEQLDPSVLREAVEKVDSVKFVVSRFDNFMGNEDKETDIGGSELSSSTLIKMGIWNFKINSYKFLHRNFQETIPFLVERYSGMAYQVNAFYFWNYVLVPLSVIHEKVFSRSLPAYSNFGGVGFMLGHELVHAVADERSLSSTDVFRSGELCLIQQLDRFSKKIGLKVNGSLSKEENAADLEGFRESYKAYENFQKSHPPEKLLPGFQEYSSQQLFWLVAASNWCHVYSPEAMAVTLQDNHAPLEHRINGQLANIPEFARDYNCPIDTAMNPKEKCRLW